MLRGFKSHVGRNLVAYLALFVALGGTSYAAAKFTGAEIIDESLTGADVRNDSLTGSDVLESSLGQVPSAATAATASSAGDANTLDGKDSTAFFGKVQTVTSAPTTVLADQVGEAYVPCPAGTTVTGGGHAAIDGRVIDYSVWIDKPSRNGWNVWIINRDSANTNTDAIKFEAYALCASP